MCPGPRHTPYMSAVNTEYMWPLPAMTHLGATSSGQGMPFSPEPPETGMEVLSGNPIPFTDTQASAVVLTGTGEQRVFPGSWFHGGCFCYGSAETQDVG